MKNKQLTTRDSNLATLDWVFAKKEKGVNGKFFGPHEVSKPNYRFPMNTARKDLKQRPEDELQKTVD